MTDQSFHFKNSNNTLRINLDPQSIRILVVSKKLSSNESWFGVADHYDIQNMITTQRTNSMNFFSNVQSFFQRYAAHGSDECIIQLPNFDEPFFKPSTYYAQHIIALMVGAGSIGLLVLSRHIKGINQRKHFNKGTITIDFVTSIMLNLIMSWGGIIGFGRPYTPGIVYLSGVFVAELVGISLSGLIEWMEKLAIILSMLSLACEYFFIGILH